MYRDSGIRVRFPLPTACIPVCMGAALLMGLANAQSPVMLKDINQVKNIRATGSDPNHNRPAPQTSPDRSFVKLGPVTFFVATTAQTGTEPYTSLGTKGTTQMLADIYPGPGSSTPKDLVIVGKDLFFSADDGKNGRELWVRDTSGVRLVKDIQPGPVGSNPTNLAVMGTKVLFAADGGTQGSELWISDGTAAGTVQVKDIQTGAGSSTPRNMRANTAGTLMFFAAEGTAGDTEPWVSDGTAAGTKLLKDIRSGTTASNPSYLQALGSKVVFQANDGNSGNELWITDGTSAGTVLVKDLRPGTGSGTNLLYSIVVGNKLFFQGNDGATGNEVWVTDGTALGTKVVADIWPGTSTGGFYYPAEHNGKVYFGSRTSSSGYQIFETDGTTTKPVTGVMGTSTPQYLAFGGNTLFFAGRGNNGIELWISDLTPAGTKELLDINKVSATASSSPNFITETIPGTVVFTADDGVNGREFWTSNGTVAGTFMTDINQPTVTPTNASSPSNFVGLFGPVLFSANDGVSGVELWRTGGTQALTNLLKDINPGTATGSPFYFARLGKLVLFRANDGAAGYEPWVSDGTLAGTKLLVDIRSGSTSSSPAWFTRVGDRVYFTANDGTSGVELWVTDGTPAGTKLFKDIRAGSSSSSPAEITAWGSQGGFLFRANDGVNGNELWISDGTPAGTKLLKDISSGSASSSPNYLTEALGKVFFAANDGSTGIELWMTDGTSAGTKLLKDIYPGQTNGRANNSSPGFFAELAGRLFFSADDGIVGSELWVTDGTSAGTVLFMDLDPGRGGGSSRNSIKEEVGTGPDYLTRVGSRHIWFAAPQYPKGVEIWRTDGTKTGTKMIADINPGNGSSSPQNRGDGYDPVFAVSRGKIFFSADDGTHGREPWVVDNGATATSIGHGCGSSTLSATDPMLGKSMTISGSTGLANSVHVLLIGAPTSSPIQIVGNCTNYLDFKSFAVLYVTPVTLSWSVPVTVPNQAILLGSTATIQSWVLPPSFPKGIELSNGVDLTFGN